MPMISMLRRLLRGVPAGPDDRAAAREPAIAGMSGPPAGPPAAGRSTFAEPVAPPVARLVDAEATVPGGPLPTERTHADAERAGANLQADFSALLLGVGRLRSGAPSAAERRVLRQIEILVHGQDDAHLVPRLPAVLPQLMALARRDDVSPREIADRLSRDPTLVGEVVRLANAGRHGGGRPIAHLQEAVLILGQRGLNQLVARVAMRPLYGQRQGRFSLVAGHRVWDLTERSAQACALVCAPSADPFHGYLAGLVANVGLIAALRALDIGFHEPSPPESADFHRTLHATVAQLSARIARGWNFPEQVCVAVDRLSGPGEAAVGSLAAALRLADRAAKRHLLSPDLDADALAVLPPDERSCHLALELAFRPATETARAG